jgi:pyruvate/2-oxoglutarate dehydrogenase complex dihydrolipoamide acyltransferase (E2) component
MPIPLLTPRLNNNDDVVAVRQIVASAGAPIRKGDPIVELETDKAVFVVESEHDGFLLKVTCAEGDQAAVGSVLAWIGGTPDEAVPEIAARDEDRAAATPTAKAQLLLRRYGLEAGDVPFAGARLTAQAVLNWVAARGLQPKAAAPALVGDAPLEAGDVHPLSAEERGMLRTVLWQRQQAVPGYIEIASGETAWKEYGLAFMKQHRLLVNPVLSLMAWRLADLARQNPRLNSTMVEGGRHVYRRVNLGFTVQSGEALYLTVVQDAGAMDEAGFVNRLAELQRHAMVHKLKPAEVQGATIGFSSMARWQVARHVPVLPPFTSMIVAHAAGVLGATYDHRVLNGFDVVSVLRKIGTPPTARSSQ